jgi:hypothetical protein
MAAGTPQSKTFSDSIYSTMNVTWYVGLKTFKEQFIFAKQRIASKIGAAQICSSALAMNRT